jgi:hypothetical protein
VVARSRGGPDRLELAIADLQAAAANGEQLARVGSLVEQALEDDEEIDSPTSSTPAVAVDEHNTEDESPSELTPTNPPNLFLKLGTTSPASPSTTADLIEPYIPWTPRRVGSIAVLDALPRQDAARAVEALIREIVATEGPVHLVRLAKLVAAAFALNKVAQSRATAILYFVPAEMKARSTEPFAWPTDLDPSTWRRARATQQGDIRALDHVSLVEIANAMSIVSEASAGLAEPDLKREALAVFGGKRMTDAISARLDEALTWGLENSRLERTTLGIIQSINLT